MRGSLSFLLVMFGVLAVGLGGLGAGDVRADPGDFVVVGDRVWSGSVQVPSVELGLMLTLTPTEDGGWTGALDIEMHGVKGAAVGDLVVTETGLAFNLPLPGMPENAIPVFDLEIDETGRIAMGTMAQAGMTFPVKLELKTAEEVALEAANRRPQTPRPPFSYRTIEVRVPVAGDDGGAHILAGTLALPDPEAFGEGPYACAVFLTGSGPQDRDETIFGHRPFAVIADALARAGVASLRCDERGIGESTGDFATADSYDFAADALAQVRFAGARAEIDADRVGLIGHSEGGLTAAMVAAEGSEGSELVSFVVSLAGMGLTGRETLLGQTAAMMLLGGADEAFVARNRELQAAFYDLYEAGAPAEEQRGALMALVRLQMGPRGAFASEAELAPAVDQQMAVYDTAWMRVLISIDPARYLRGVRQPILVLNGELDVQVLPDENLEAIREALAVAGNDDVTVHRLPGLNHLFQNVETGAMQEYAATRETFDPGALDILVRWVADHSSR